MYRLRNCHGVPAPTRLRYRLQPTSATMYITKWNTCRELGAIAEPVTIARICDDMLGVGSGPPPRLNHRRCDRADLIAFATVRIRCRTSRVCT